MYRSMTAAAIACASITISASMPTWIPGPSWMLYMIATSPRLVGTAHSCPEGKADAKSRRTREVAR